jgi:hypothetical protein
MTAQHVSTMGWRKETIDGEDRRRNQLQLRGHPDEERRRAWERVWKETVVEHGLLRPTTFRFANKYRSVSLIARLARSSMLTIMVERKEGRTPARSDSEVPHGLVEVSCTSDGWGRGEAVVQALSSTLGGVRSREVTNDKMAVRLDPKRRELAMSIVR